MKLRVGLAGLLLTILACADPAGPIGRSVALSIVPRFDNNGFLSANNADRLRIRIQRDDGAGFLTIKDTTVAIDADGNAAADVNVVLVQSPQLFRVLLDAIRSADGAVLFSGSQDVTVSNALGAGPPPAVQVPIVYAGPRGARVAIAPRDTSVTSGGSFSFRATVFDAGNSPIGVPVGFYLVNSADASKLTLNRLTGAATALPGQKGVVLVYAMSADSLRDTTGVTLGQSVPAAIRVAPGYGNVAVGGGMSLTGSVLDNLANVIPQLAVPSWTSRNPAVATVNGSGGVSGVAPGTAVIVASGYGFSDSALVTVPVAGNVVVSTTSSGRGFRDAMVGDIVTVDITADMQFASGEKLGSYGATIAWDPTRFAYIDVQAGGFSFPVINDAGAAAGSLNLAQADANGSSGAPVLARIRLQAISKGTAAVSVSLTEMSGIMPTFTNFFASGRVTVTNGNVTVR